MAINYPTSLDTLTNPTSTDKVSTVDHATQHANVNDAIEALEAKVGADSSAVTTSHDYKLSGVTGSDKASSLAGSETLTNKTLTSPAVNGGTITGTTLAGSTGTGVHDFGGATSFELPNSATPTVDANGEVAVDTTVTDFSHGVMKYYSGEEMAVVAVPVAELTSPTNGDIVTYNSTANEFQLAQPAEVVNKPGVISYDITGNSAMACLYIDEEAIVARNGTSTFYVSTAGNSIQSRDTSNEFTGNNNIRSAVVLNGYIYVLLSNSTPDPDEYELWRYDLTDLTSSPTQITFGVTNPLTDGNITILMSSDGTDFYFTYIAGNSANVYDIGRYTLSGTVLTYASTISLSDSSTIASFTRLSTGEIVIRDGSGYLKDYNSSGTLQNTSDSTTGNYDNGMLSFADTIYVADDTTAVRQYVKIFV